MDIGKTSIFPEMKMVNRYKEKKMCSLEELFVI